MANLKEIFRSHAFSDGEPYIDLYHVYDNLSRTPFIPGEGIFCEDRDNYIMNSWHVITPSAMRKHLDWSNREPTQFISLYGDFAAAVQAKENRLRVPFIRDVGKRDPDSVKIAHVRLDRNSTVWAFSRAEMLDMMRTFGDTAWSWRNQADRNEWFVWGDISAANIINRHTL